MITGLGQRLESWFKSGSTLAEHLAECLKQPEADGKITVFHECFFSHGIDLFLEELDRLTQARPEIEIGALVKFAGSVTDVYEYAAFYSRKGFSTIRDTGKGGQGWIVYEGFIDYLFPYKSEDGTEYPRCDDEDLDFPAWFYAWEKQVRFTGEKTEEDEDW